MERSRKMIIVVEACQIGCDEVDSGIEEMKRKASWPVGAFWDKTEPDRFRMISGFSDLPYKGAQILSFWLEPRGSKVIKQDDCLDAINEERVSRIFTDFFSEEKVQVLVLFASKQVKSFLLETGKIFKLVAEGGSNAVVMVC